MPTPAHPPTHALHTPHPTPHLQPAKDGGVQRDVRHGRVVCDPGVRQRVGQSHALGGVLFEQSRHEVLGRLRDLLPRLVVKVLCRGGGGWVSVVLVGCGNSMYLMYFLLHSLSAPQHGTASTYNTVQAQICHATRYCVQNISHRSGAWLERPPLTTTFSRMRWKIIQSERGEHCANGS